MVAPNYRHCLQTAAAAAGRTIDAELDRVFSRVQGRMNRYVRAGLSEREAAQRAGAELGAEHRAQGAIQRRNELLNLQKRVARRETISGAAEGDLARKSGRADLARSLRMQIEGVHTPTQGASMSAESTMRAIQRTYSSGLRYELESSGLLKAARRGALDKETGREMYELTRTTVPGKPGITGNPIAQKLAEIYVRYGNMMKRNLNREGAWIGDYDGYVTRTEHEPVRVFNKGNGFDEWRREALAAFGNDRTFEGVDDPEKFLKNIWSEISAGEHFTDNNEIGLKDPAFAGPSNLAKKLSTSRILHANDFESWWNYQQKYGQPGTLLEKVDRTLKRAAQQEALLRRWGTNPQAEFDSDIRWLQQKYTDRDIPAKQAFDQKIEGLRTLFSHLTGEANRPVNRLGAQIASHFRSVEEAAKLGFVAFTHLFSAILTKGPELRFQGANFLEAHSNVFTSFLHGFPEGDRPEALKLMLSAIDGANSSIAVHGWIGDNFPGTVSRIRNNYFKMTGLTWLLDAQKRGVVWFMSHHLGDQLGKDFGDLIPETQRALRMYDIKPEDWKALGSVSDHPVHDGRTFLTPDAATRAGLSARDGDTLALKLNAYYHDVADRSIITPGIGDRALILGGTRPGTMKGEMLRFISQFKLWPIAMIRQFWGREIYGRGQGLAGAATGVITTALLGMALGYGRMVTTDLLKGLEPRSPNDPRTWGHALAQSGGFGLLGDFLFGQTNRFHQGLAETIAGPVLGEGANALTTMWNNIKEGDAKAVPSEMARTVTSNLPFVNLFYGRAALNYLFLHSLMESLNPGYLRRSQQAMQRNTGQTYLAPSTPMLGWMNPQSHLHTFGR